MLAFTHRMWGSGQPAPRFSFAAIADIQYADRDSAGKRDYRNSLPKLQAAVPALAAEKLAFTIQLGDLIDQGSENLGPIAAVFRRMPGPRFHVLGNHDFFGSRTAVLQRFGLRRAYYTFHFPGWQFVVLDGMNVSVKGGWPPDSANFQRGEKILAELKAQRARNANDWNGALGDQQRAWLGSVLESARQRNDRAILFCHFPALPQACRPDHLLWDHRELLELLDAHPAVAAYISGHDHNGGYAEHNGVHHLTLAGLVENDLAACLRVLDVYPDRLVLRRPGEQHGRVLQLGRYPPTIP